MIQAANRPPVQADILARVRSLSHELSERAAENEKLGRLSDDTVRDLREAGLFGLFAPKVFGGAELWPTEGLEILEAVSHADGSTGWVVMAVQVSIATAAAYLAPSAAKDVFKDGIAVIAGQGAPAGRADPRQGGFQLNGNWNYGSGLLHSTWAHTGGLVYENGQPRLYPGKTTPDSRIFIVPIAQVDVKSNWDVIGLRATGSVDYSIRDTFVPEEFTHRLSANRPHQGGDLYRLGIPGLATLGHTGFALGLARRMLDEIAALAVAPRRPSTMPEHGGGESFHAQYGAAEGRWRAARAFAYDSWGDIQSTLQTGTDMSVRQLTTARLALTHATAVASDIGRFVFEYGGGIALRAGVLQRCFRDQRAGAQHFTTSEFIVRECARELLNLREGKVWSLRQLVDSD